MRLDAGPRPDADLVRAKGLAHEAAYLERLRGEGREVASVPDGVAFDERVALTAEAMRAGAEVIYQGALAHGR